MSKFSGLKKSDKISFIEQADVYSEAKGIKKGEKVTFTMNSEYINLLNELSKKDRLSKSGIIRVSLVKFSQLSKKERENSYEEVIANNTTPIK